MEPFVLTIFGITSNLASLKLVPALYDLEEKGLISKNSKIVGVARSDMSTNDFQSLIENILKTENRHHLHDTKPQVAKSLLSKMVYLNGDLDNSSKNSIYPKLKKYLYSSENKQLNHIYYLATFPDLYAGIFNSLKKHGLSQKKKGWTRLMIEKPIGNDYKSAKKLDILLKKYFLEEQIYRLDHYLGKETIQNILVFRFGNGLLEPLMNNKYVDHIQITAAEDFGVGARGGYFDTMGTLKDVGQNHLLQMLVVATMSAPAKFTNRQITDERIKILKKLKTKPSELVLGQYNGYLYEDKIDPNSKSDTFFALKTEINSKVWSGVPIYIRAGKKLARTVTEISIIFKVPINRMFSEHELGERPNVLTYRIQPSEGIGIELLTKKPGHKFQLDNNFIQYCYSSIQKKYERGLINELNADMSSLAKQAVLERGRHGQNENNHYDAYEKLIYDAIQGDPTFFNDSPEVEASWKFIDSYYSKKTELYLYEPGSWGPKEADKLIEKDGRKWLEPSLALCNI